MFISEETEHTLNPSHPYDSQIERLHAMLDNPSSACAIIKNLQTTVAKAAYQLLSRCAVSPRNSNCDDTTPNNSKMGGLDGLDEGSIADYLEPIRTILSGIDAECLLMLSRVLDEAGAALQPGYDIFEYCFP